MRLVLIIPFMLLVSSAPADREFSRKLNLTELKIIVNWLIIIALSWLFHQLTEFYFVALMIRKKLLVRSSATNSLQRLIWKNSRLMTQMGLKKYVSLLMIDTLCQRVEMELSWSSKLEISRLVLINLNRFCLFLMR